MGSHGLLGRSSVLARGVGGRRASLLLLGRGRGRASGNGRAAGSPAGGSLLTRHDCLRCVVFETGGCFGVWRDGLERVGVPVQARGGKTSTSVGNAVTPEARARGLLFFCRAYFVSKPIEKPGVASHVEHLFIQEHGGLGVLKG